MAVAWSTGAANNDIANIVAVKKNNNFFISLC